MQTREAFIFCAVQKAIKEMRDKKATGDDDVPGDVLKLLGEDGHSIVTQLIDNIYERRVVHDFTEVTMIATEKPKATKCSNHCTISLIAHTAKIVVRILRRRIERKTKDFLGEDQFGFRRRRGTRNAIGILRITPDKLWI
jgi:hypothetical protein